MNSCLRRFSSGSLYSKLRRSYRRAPEPSSPEVTQLLDNYTAVPPLPLTLSRLLSFGRPVTEQSVLESVSYVQTEIPRRLATRVRSLEALPFIVGTNPYVSNILSAHRNSFELLATYPPVRTLAENAEFVAELDELVQRHGNDVPTMAKGFQECSRYISASQISDFLDGAINNRISVRLIAEQHIALSQALEEPRIIKDTLGVVDAKCSPRDMIKMCGSFVRDLCEATLGSSPSLTIDGHVDATFVYVPVHLEYILTEVLKNSFRATVEHRFKQNGRSSAQDLPPVTITISPPPDVPGLNEKRFLSMRIRDQGGGVTPSDMSKIFSYAFTTAGSHGEDERSEGPYMAQQVGGSGAIGNGEGNLFAEITGKGLQTGMGTIAGLGYGLPMSRLYAKYFGGSLGLVSLDGWGSDVFLKLRCLDSAGDIEI